VRQYLGLPRNKQGRGAFTTHTPTVSNLAILWVFHLRRKIPPWRLVEPLSVFLTFSATSSRRANEEAKFGISRRAVHGALFYLELSHCSSREETLQSRAAGKLHGTAAFLLCSERGQWSSDWHAQNDLQHCRAIGITSVRVAVDCTRWDTFAEQMFRKCSCELEILIRPDHRTGEVFIQLAGRFWASSLSSSCSRYSVSLKSEITFVQSSINKEPLHDYCVVTTIVVTRHFCNSMFVTVCHKFILLRRLKLLFLSLSHLSVNSSSCHRRSGRLF